RLTDFKPLYAAGISIYGLCYNPSENALYWRERSTGVFRGIMNHENRTISNVVKIMSSLTTDEGGIAVLHR
ncbi:MAG: hypothetical protein Q8K36_07000, partial [Alphaproteobacteria bacterium]|nr:hypothetical protein [Alphaproteobacteria bacterium]